MGAAGEEEGGEKEEREAHGARVARWWFMWGRVAAGNDVGRVAGVDGGWAGLEGKALSRLGRGMRVGGA